MTDVITARPGARNVGPVGTAARAVVGALLLADVVMGHASGGWRAMSWFLALVVFPAVLLVAQWTRARRGATRLRATGPVGHVLNITIFLLLYFTPSYAPALEATSDAALIFYGASMVVAAVRGYAGCEVLAVSNWILGRNDQVGCVLFAPVDFLEGSTTQVEDSA